MKLLPRLSLDQIGHAPGRPQRSAIAQGLWTFLQTLAQCVQLRWLQTRFATGAGSLAQRFGPLFPPGLMPAADRLPVNAQSPGHFPLVKPSVKKPGGFEPSPFQFIKIAFDAFRITHAQRLARQMPHVTIFRETQ